MRKEFSAKHIEEILGASRQRLHQMRLMGIISPSVNKARGQGERNKFSFDDLVDIAVILKLLKFGVDYFALQSYMHVYRRRLAKKSGLEGNSGRRPALIGLQFFESGIIQTIFNVEDLDTEKGQVIIKRELEKNEDLIIISPKKIEENLREKIKNM